MMTHREIARCIAEDSLREYAVEGTRVFWHFLGPVPEGGATCSLEVEPVFVERLTPKVVRTWFWNTRKQPPDLLLLQREGRVWSLRAGHLTKE
jgi:hypothetical protein